MTVTRTCSVSEAEIRPHHRTCQSLKHSVELGCYICNGIWESLDSTEQDVISSVTDSSEHSASSGIGPCVGDSAKGSAESSITQSSLEDGRAFGSPGYYLLQFDINGSSLFTPEMIQKSAYWRTTFILQPRDGGFIPSHYS